MMGWPHTATYEDRGFSIVNMERQASLATAVQFPCLVEPLSPKDLEGLAFSVERPMARISWPPLASKELVAGDKIKFPIGSGSKAYELSMVQADIYRATDPYYTAILCGGKK